MHAPVTEPGKGIKSWSASKLAEADKCSYRVYLMHVLRVPEPRPPLPEGKTEYANDRGTRVHQAAENYVNGTGPMTLEMMKFKPEFEKLNRLYKQGAVSLEGEWGVDESWAPTSYRTAWHRCKIDTLVHLNEEEAVVVDYKTGRRFGNEVKHNEQMQIYQLNTFARYPKLQVVTTELWYLDVDDLASMKYTRMQGMMFMRKFTERGNALVNKTVWKSNPNKYSCKYCQYGPWGSGDCKDGVR